MIRISEEIVLLTLDYNAEMLNRKGSVNYIRHAINGAILLDLALNNGIDTDLEQLFVTDSIPLNNPMLDWVFAWIIKNKQIHSVDHWVRIFAFDNKVVLLQLCNRLIDSGSFACGLWDYSLHELGQTRLMPKIKKNTVLYLIDQAVARAVHE